MPESVPKPNNDSRPSVSFFPNPLAYWAWRRGEQIQRDREALRAYFQEATPMALLAEGHYGRWREAISEPIQDAQKAANISANFWWQITDQLRKFRLIKPPKPAERYYKLFAEALRSASEGADIAKSGFRFSKFYVVSRGMGYLDKYVELMGEAERELGRLDQKYRLIEEPTEPEPPVERSSVEQPPTNQPPGEQSTGERPTAEQGEDELPASG